MVHIPTAHRHKLQTKAEECWFIGYCKTTKAWMFWNDKTRKSIVSRDAEFFEKEIYCGNTDEQQSSTTLEFAEPIEIETTILVIF
jgi:hypothetical protein